MKKLDTVASNWTALIGCACLGLGLVYCAMVPAENPVSGALFLLMCYLIPVALFEILGRKIHRRASTGLDWETSRSPNLQRVVVKLVGFFGIMAAMIAIHAVFRIYAVERLILPLAALQLLLPVCLPLVIAYFYFVDRRMREPHDGYYEFGQLLLRRNTDPDWALLRDFALGWMIKGFFLPVMFAYLALQMPRLHLDLNQLMQGPVAAAVYLTTALVIVELTIVVVGYAMTLRLFDAHIRSPNGLLGAWVVTLICYEPFNKIASGQIYPYRTEQDWSAVAGDYALLMWPWIILVLSAFLLWVWATAIFGLRWSNLTHRGIITNGPYAFTKHPDYVAKSLFFWLTAAPFLTAATPWQAVTGTLSLFVINAVYFGRARMEEKHLSEDPDYVEYALAMNERSIFRGMARYLPFLTYHAPDRQGSDTGRKSDAPQGLPAE